MRVIRRFAVSPQLGDLHISLPKGANILHVAKQGDEGTFWALVDPDADEEDIVFRVYATGQEIADDCCYIGTFMQLGGALVWHLFRVEGVTDP
jgi:hypothetical protein